MYWYIIGYMTFGTNVDRSHQCDWTNTRDHDNTVVIRVVTDFRLVLADIVVVTTVQCRHDNQSFCS